MNRLHWMSFILIFTTVAAADQPPARPPADLSVLILPFEPTGDAATHDWGARALQQNLLNDLARVQGAQPLLPVRSVPSPLNLAAARAEADHVGASLVVFGAIQSGNAGLRITGQVLDARTGRLIGTLKATGAMRDLFGLEDTIAEQLRRIVITQVSLVDETKPFVPVLPAAVAEVLQKPAARAPGAGELQLPWQNDQAFINAVRQRILNNDDYDRSYYWYNYGSTYYGLSGRPFGYGGWVGWYSGGFRQGWHSSHGTGGVVFFPGGVIRVGGW